MSNPSAPGSSTPPKSPGPGSTSRPGVFAALSHPRYRNFWLGSVASTGAAQLLIMAQGWLVFELSGSPMDLGLLGAAASIPTIAGSVYGGVLADRLDKRRVLIVTSVISALLMWLLAALDASGEVAVWHVLAITAVMALIAALDLPARQAIFPMLIDRAQMMSAIALNSMLWQGTRMIFPAIGGLVIAASDTWVVFAASGFGYVAMVVVLVRLGPVSQPKPVGASMTQMMEGLRFIFTTRLFAVLIPLTYTIMFFGTSFVQLMPLFAAELGTDERGFGVLISASGRWFDGRHVIRRPVARLEALGPNHARRWVCRRRCIDLFHGRHSLVGTYSRCFLHCASLGRGDRRMQLAIPDHLHDRLATQRQ